MGRKESRRKENKWQRSVREPIRDTRGEQRASALLFPVRTRYEDDGKGTTSDIFRKGRKGHDGLFKSSSGGIELIQLLSNLEERACVLTSVRNRYTPGRLNAAWCRNPAATFCGYVSRYDIPSCSRATTIRKRIPSVVSPYLRDASRPSTTPPQPRVPRHLVRCGT